MRLFVALTAPLTLAALAFSAGCDSKRDQPVAESARIESSNSVPQPTTQMPKPTVFTAKAAIPKDPQLEQRITDILSQMTLEQKIGQMIQVRIGDVTLEEIQQYGIGSILNGGGQIPNNNPDATAKDWAEYADSLFQASITKGNHKIAIPIFWGTDAVHGHGNVKGATLFPHNIGLGASRNEQLVREISKATAVEVAATGIDWNFAPTIAVAKDIRWGRTYESFSEDSKLVSDLGAQVVIGLQGDVNSEDFLSQTRVIATAKHFIGDGGTAFGDDQGYTYGNQEALLVEYLPAYINAIESGVQTVMASYNYWNGINAHASKALLTDLLKDQLGFDGLVVSDWQAIAKVPGCTIDNCAAAVNAGIDLFMIPKKPDWKLFYSNTLAQVKNNEIPVARIDDAVSRILRVKLRADLWSKPSPSKRALAGKNQLIGSAKHRELARQAVRESLVLLKNQKQLLPLQPNQTILITGSGANNMSMQSGGWSVSWQGTDNTNDKYPNSTTIYSGLAASIKAAGGTPILDTANKNQTIDAAIVVFGEKAYAEMWGDIQNTSTLEVEQNDKKSLQLMRELKSQGIPVIAVLLSGRPLWVNKELNIADAFVAAWLPGTEGAGVADVLLSKKDGSVNHDFKGKLSFSWPKYVCDATHDKTSKTYSPLYPFGFGLNYTSPLKPWSTLNDNTEAWTLGCRLGNSLPELHTKSFTESEGWMFYAEGVNLERQLIKGPATLGSISANLDPINKNIIQAQWNGTEEGRLNIRNDSSRNEFPGLFASQGAVIFDVNLKSIEANQIKAVVYSGHLGGSSVDIQDHIKSLPIGKWKTLSIDLNCFAKSRADMNKITIPFGIHTKGHLDLSITNVRYEANKAANADISCQQP